MRSRAERDALALANRSLAYWYARRVKLSGAFRELPLEDVEAAALLGLLQAADRYDSERAAFTTCASWCMRGAVGDAYRAVYGSPSRRRVRLVQLPKVGDDLDDDGLLDPEDDAEPVDAAADRAEARDDVRAALLLVARTHPRHAFVLASRYGIGGSGRERGERGTSGKPRGRQRDREASRIEIARRLAEAFGERRVIGERVRQIETRARALFVAALLEVRRGHARGRRETA